MAELDGDPNPWRKAPEGRLQSPAVDGQPGWQLEEDRAQLAVEAGNSPHESVDWFGRRGKPLDVGQIATHLDGHGEVVRRSVGPTLEGSPFRQPIEGTVGFDGRNSAAYTSSHRRTGSSGG